MSNIIGYSIPACSKGESFNFANSLGNDSTGGSLIYNIGGVRRNANIDLPIAWWPLTEDGLDPARTAYGSDLVLPSSIIHNGEGRTDWHRSSLQVEDFGSNQILEDSTIDSPIGRITEDGVTWMVWVNGFINDNYRYIFMRHNGYPQSETLYEYYLETYDGGWSCYVAVDGGNYGFVSGTGNSVIPSGWHLLTFRITSSRISVWVDGVKNAEGAEFGGPLLPADPRINMKIFGWIDMYTEKFQCKGKFQDLLWFNKGVSDETITWFYNNGQGRIPTDLINYTPGCTSS